MDYSNLCKTKKVALQFSGGKDSLALLHMMQPYWGDLTVYYCNSGDSFPETDALIEVVKTIVPHFVEVKGRKAQTEQRFGWPSDLLTSSSTSLGQALGDTGPRLIDRFTCCFHTLMEPMHERMLADGVEVILRGQRNSDRLQNPVRSGEVIGPFTIVYPIADFTEQQVFEYLTEHGIPIPPFYQDGMTSGGDCLHCSAWLEHGQAKYLKKHHPQAAKVVFQRLEEIKKAADENYKRLCKALEDSTNGMV